MSVYFSSSQMYFLLVSTHFRFQTRDTFSQCLSLAACLLICPPKGNLNEVSQLFSMKVNCFRTATNKRVNLCLMPEVCAAGSGL